MILILLYILLDLAGTLESVEVLRRTLISYRQGVNAQVTINKNSLEGVFTFVSSCLVKQVQKQDFQRARQNIVPASHRVSVTPVKSLSLRIQPLLQGNLSRILSQLEILCPVGMLVCDVM